MEITKEVLDRLRKHQQKEYFGSQAQSMFVDGVFNYDNWNGGDGLIRQYFSHWNDNGVFNDTKVEELDFTFNGTHFWGDMIVTHTYYEDQSYATIVFSGMIENNEQIVLDKFEDVAYFSWYKSRGRTDSGKYNGQLMTEDQYLFVLNAIVTSGFKFDINE